MSEYISTLIWLVSRLEEYSGGRIELMIHAGAVLIVLLVVGKLLARLVFRSDSGHLAVLLAALLPLALAVVGWSVFFTWYNPPLFRIQDLVVDVALLVGLLLLLVPGVFVTARLLTTAFGKALLFLVLAYAASAGGLVVSHASITVFGAGAEQVESRQERLDDNG